MKWIKSRSWMGCGSNSHQFWSQLQGLIPWHKDAWTCIRNFANVTPSTSIVTDGAYLEEVFPSFGETFSNLSFPAGCSRGHLTIQWICKVKGTDFYLLSQMHMMWHYLQLFLFIPYWISDRIYRLTIMCTDSCVYIHSCIYIYSCITLWHNPNLELHQCCNIGGPQKLERWFTCRLGLAVGKWVERHALVTLLVLLWALL